MTNQKIFKTTILAVFLTLGSFIMAQSTMGQGDCQGGINCPTFKLFTDGVYHVNGSTCCKQDGPVCTQTLSGTIVFYDHDVPSNQFGCEAMPEPCHCKAGPPIGSVDATGETITFNPDAAQDVAITNGTCDDYYVKVDGANEWYRCFNVTFTQQGNNGGGKFAFKSSKDPAPKYVQTYVTTKSTVNGVEVLVVKVLDGSGGTTDKTFEIAKKD